MAFESFLPSPPRTRPWWTTSGSLAERPRDPPLHLDVRSVIRAPDDVRDAELEVVEHGGELVRGRAVRAQKRRPAQAHGPILVPGRAARGERVRRPHGRTRRARLADRAVVERDFEPREVSENRLLTALHGPRRIGVVDAQDERPCVLVCEPPVRHGRQGVSQMQRAGRARREADAYLHRRPHASIATCPGWAETRSSQARTADTSPARTRPRARRAYRRRGTRPRSSTHRRPGTPGRRGAAHRVERRVPAGQQTVLLPFELLGPVGVGSGSERRRRTARGCTARRTSTAVPAPARTGRWARTTFRPRSTRGSRSTPPAGGRRRAGASARAGPGSGRRAAPGG